MAKLSSVPLGSKRYPKPEPSRLSTDPKRKPVFGSTSRIDYNVDSSTWK